MWGWFPVCYTLELHSPGAEVVQCLLCFSGSRPNSALSGGNQKIWSSRTEWWGVPESKKADVSGVISTPGNNLKRSSVTTPFHTP